MVEKKFFYSVDEVDHEWFVGLYWGLFFGAVLSSVVIWALLSVT